MVDCKAGTADNRHTEGLAAEGRSVVNSGSDSSNENGECGDGHGGARRECAAPTVFVGVASFAENDRFA